MATAKQCCEYIDACLRLPPGLAEDCAESLRAAGMLPSTPGIPAQINSQHVALLLLSAVHDKRRAHGHAARIAEYSVLRPVLGGRTLGETIAGFIDNPHDVLELCIDLTAPGAVVTAKRHDGHVERTSYVAETPHTRPAFAVEAVLPPEIFIRLSAAIASAPPVRGRAPALDRYRRVERAVVYN